MAVAVSNILNTLPENDMDLKESVKEPLSLVYAVDTVMDGGKLGISLEEYEEQDGIVFVKEGHDEDLAGGLRPNDIIESVTYHFGEEEVTSKITCISDFKKILGMKELQPPIEIRYSRKIIHSPPLGRRLAGALCIEVISSQNMQLASLRFQGTKKLHRRVEHLKQAKNWQHSFPSSSSM